MHLFLDHYFVKFKNLIRKFNISNANTNNSLKTIYWIILINISFRKCPSSTKWSGQYWLLIREVSVCLLLAYQPYHFVMISINCHQYVILRLILYVKIFHITWKRSAVLLQSQKSVPLKKFNYFHFISTSFWFTIYECSEEINISLIIFSTVMLSNQFFINTNYQIWIHQSNMSNILLLFLPPNLTWKIYFFLLILKHLWKVSSKINVIFFSCYIIILILLYYQLHAHKHLFLFRFYYVNYFRC